MEPLLPQHQQLIASSGIEPAVAAERGYRSLTSRAELQRLGFGEAQRRTPALVIPIWSAAGERAGYQARPDDPRMLDGKSIKYETPRGATMHLDVPPRARPGIRDPAQPLFVTEGVRKADAAVSRGLCCLALLGVWNWRGTNEWGGKTALPDWELIALADRQVYLVFDSDVMLKRPVHAALARLKTFLESRGARVALVYLPPGEGGTKVGLDDFLAQGHGLAELLALASPALRPLPAGEPVSCEHHYRETPGGLVWSRPTKDGQVEVPLTNFIAHIATDIVEASARAYLQAVNKLSRARTHVAQEIRGTG